MREIGVADADACAALADGLFSVMRRVWRAPDRLAAIVHPRDLLARTRMRPPGHAVVLHCDFRFVESASAPLVAL